MSVSPKTGRFQAEYKICNNHCMVIIVEKDQTTRRKLHQLFESCLLANNLITVHDQEQLLLTVERVSPSSIWLSNLDESLLSKVRNLPALSQTPIYILATSSMSVHPALLKKYRAKTVLTPLQPYQIQQLANGAIDAIS